MKETDDCPDCGTKMVRKKAKLSPIKCRYTASGKCTKMCYYYDEKAKKCLAFIGKAKPEFEEWGDTK